MAFWAPMQSTRAGTAKGADSLEGRRSKISRTTETSVAAGRVPKLERPLFGFYSSMRRFRTISSAMVGSTVRRSSALEHASQVHISIVVRYLKRAAHAVISMFRQQVPFMTWADLLFAWKVLRDA